MTQYILIDPVTGEQHTLSELELTRNIQLGCILLRDEERIGIITHRDLVAFARWCAGEMLVRLVDEPDQRVVHVLSLVDRWLEDQQSVTPEELKAAAPAAWAAAEAVWATWAARAATWAARAAAGAAEAAAEAVWAADAAVDAAVDAADVRAVSYETQAKWLVEHLQSGK